jgi:hypothetical protein
MGGSSIYKNNCTSANKFIAVNQLHSNITNAARLITALTIPSTLPIRYIGTNNFVAGSRIVKLSIALAEIKNIASTISQ